MLTDTPSHVLIQQLRWMAVLCQLFILSAMFAPVRNIAGYSESWAHLAASASSIPNWVFVGWFIATMLLSAPLMAGLIVAPRSAFTRHAVSFNAFGAFLAGFGHFYLTSWVATLGAPSQVIAAYFTNAVLLLGGAMVMACWKNTRHVSTYHARHRGAAQGAPCDASKG